MAFRLKSCSLVRLFQSFSPTFKRLMNRTGRELKDRTRDWPRFDRIQGPAFSLRKFFHDNYEAILIGWNFHQPEDEKSGNLTISQER